MPGGMPMPAPASRFPVTCIWSPIVHISSRSLLPSACQLLCNDSDVSRVAAVFGTPSIVLADESGAARRASHDRERHRVLADDPSCLSGVSDACEDDHLCVRAIGVDVVIDLAGRLLAMESHHVL